MTARFKEIYEKEIVPALIKEFGYKNKMEVPKLEKIVLNMGVGDATEDRKALDGALRDMEAIAGQKPVVTHAKKSIAGFKVRENMALGCKVTLRREKMYEFLDRLITMALPRVRDFRGTSAKSFDGNGNYDTVDKIRGMDIVICTTAKTDAEAKVLLSAFGMPFKK